VRMHALLLLAGLLVGAAAALSACGSDGRIPAGAAARLESQLQRISTDVKSGACTAAQSAVVRARSIAVSLPSSVDPDLAARLRSGLQNLQAQVSRSCGQTQGPAQSTTAPTQTDQSTTSTATTTTETPTTDTGTTDTGTTGTGTTGTGTGTGTTSTGTGTSTTPTTTGTTPGAGNGTGGTPPGTTP
jgi:hypothetical protein